MLYMGMAAVNKSREGDDTPPSLNSDRAFVADAGNAPDLFTLTLHDHGVVDAIPEEPVILFPPHTEDQSSFTFPGVNPAGNISSFALFSRPPPQTI